MRQVVSSVLMVAMCIGSMASVIWVLNFGGFNLLLLAGECIAAVSTVVLAEELVEWRRRREASALHRQLLPPVS
jgi:preprotein translocase subunit SecF